MRLRLKLRVVALAFALAALAASAQSPYRATVADRHRIRVSDPQLAKELVAGGAEVIEDYGSFQLLRVSGAARATLGDRIEDRDDEDNILLNSGAVNIRDAAKLSARAAGTFAGRRLHLVQFVGPARPEWIAALTSSVRVVSYVPNNAYLVFGSQAEIARARVGAGSKLQWDGAFTDDDKLHPRLRPAEDEWLSIQLVDDPEANAATIALLDALKVEPAQSDYKILKYRNLVVHVTPGAALNLMGQPDVLSIRPYSEPRKLDERQDQIVAGNLSGGFPNGPGYLDWLASKGFTQSQFTASGFIVDVSDSGIDNGTNHPNHFALYVGGDTSQSSRVVYNRLEGTPHIGSTIQGCDGHGNLNTHIIAGCDTNTGFPHVDTLGYHYGLGVCPFVKVGSSVIFDPDKYTSPTFPDLFARAYNNGARISSHSWGGGTNDYDSDAQTFDSCVRDAQQAGSAVSVTGNQEMVIVVSAGNAGSGLNTVKSPGTAKNVITVGAGENAHSHSTTNRGNNAAGNDGCSTPDTEANSAEDVVGFSSRGPCSDGRKKPDLVAPGTHITGGAPQDAPPPSPTGTGNDLACFKGDGVCGLPGSGTVGSTNNFFPTGQQFFTTSSGTSHSCPAVSGGSALIRQYFINLGLSPPSPAMTKAYLLNSTRYQTGTSANDTLWSTSQGMGGMNLGTAFDGADRVLRDEVPADLFTGSGQSRVYFDTVSDTTQPVRITLAWSDAPGATFGNAFNNDLDLTVAANGNTYKGNVFSGASSTTGGTADAKDNVESVFLPAGVRGAITITISAANINSDGVPGNGSSPDQDFALVVYNAVTSSSPLLVSGASALVSESCVPTNGAIDPGETVSVQYSLVNIGNAKATNVVATLLPGGDVTSPSGSQNYGDIDASATSAMRSFTFTAPNGVCGSSMVVSLALSGDSGNLGTSPFTHVLGGLSITTTQAANTTSIFIPTPPLTQGKAMPYPSTITVTGPTGALSEVSVVFSNLSHSFPDDIDTLLVGPRGQTVVLMSDCGGGARVTNIWIRFDDHAASPLPDTNLIVSGSYKATDYGVTETFALPAPGPPYGTSLGVFSGTVATGTWSLYVFDDLSGDTGFMQSGWTLEFRYGTPHCCDPDTDGDGIPDFWELANFGNLTTATAISDSDGDGFSDVSEYLAGTQPTNSASLLRSTTVSNDPSGGLVIQWSSASNKLYAVDRSTNLQSGFSGMASNVAATPPVNSFTDAAATGAVLRSYRIQVQ